MAFTTPAKFLGIWVAGDVDGFTIYTDKRGRITAFEKSPPEKPPSALQTRQRQRFRAAQRSWSLLSREERARLEEACRSASVPMTGQNLWIHTSLKADHNALDTLERQTGITLPRPTTIA